MTAGINDHHRRITDLVLNVKQVALRMEGDQPRRLALSATGPGEVTAGQIATGGASAAPSPQRSCGLPGAARTAAPR